MMVVVEVVVVVVVVVVVGVVPAIQVTLHSFRMGVVGGTEVSSSALSLIEVTPLRHWEISSPFPVRLVQSVRLVLASRIEKVMLVPAGAEKFA